MGGVHQYGAPATEGTFTGSPNVYGAGEGRGDVLD